MRPLRAFLTTAVVVLLAACERNPELIGIDSPERCQYIRVIACELSRLADQAAEDLEKLVG